MKIFMSLLFIVLLVQCNSKTKIVQECNPYLTAKYLLSRDSTKDYRIYIVGEKEINNPIKLFYIYEGLEFELITTKDIISQVNPENTDLWTLLAREDVFIAGIEDFSTYDTIIKNMIEDKFTPLSYDILIDDFFDKYSVKSLKNKKFLIVIMDEATYYLTHGVEGLNMPITKFTIGNPIKVAFALKEK